MERGDGPSSRGMSSDGVRLGRDILKYTQVPFVKKTMVDRQALLSKIPKIPTNAERINLVDNQSLNNIPIFAKF
jgi:hypothetical protein